MQYTADYKSPIGNIFLAADEEGLTGLWFEGQKYYGAGLDLKQEKKEVPVILAAKRWLDGYFAGEKPDFMPALHMIGTPFQLSVWNILRDIPYGETITYGEIAGMLIKQGAEGGKCAQAVGGAVGHNKISIIIPCHRVVGANFALTGYAGGIEKKKKLLEWEGVSLK